MNVRNTMNVLTFAFGLTLVGGDSTATTTTTLEATATSPSGSTAQAVSSASAISDGLLGTPQDDCTVPVLGHTSEDEALYSFKRDGCLLGWTNVGYSDGTSPVKFDTCEADKQGLTSCPWANMADQHPLMAIQSPVHCDVYRVTFIARGGISPTDDVTDKTWMGVKLVDAWNPQNVNKHFTPKEKDNWDWQNIVWDDIPAGCWRVVVQDGSSDSHIAIQNVRISAYDMTKKMMLLDIDTEISPNHGNAEWHLTDGHRVIGYDVAWGYDKENEFEEEGRMTLGASYIYENFLAPTVVTDIMIVPTHEDSHSHVQCPSGYESRATFDPQTTDHPSPAKNDEGVSAVGAVGLCVKREPCVEGRQYVYLLEASNGNENKAQEKSLSGCKYIGSWDDYLAFSWTSGEHGHFYAGLYQCKADCKSKKCHAVKIRTMEQTGTPQFATEAGGLSLDGNPKNCKAVKDSTTTVSLHSGDETTNSKEYTLEKSLDQSFSSTMEETFSVSASVGFSFWGAEAKVGVEYDMSASQTHGFEKEMTRGHTDLHSSTTSANLKEDVTVTIPPGKQAIINTQLTFLRYETEFKAEADCLDENGYVIETKEIKGTFSGKVFESTGKTMIFTTDCVETKCSCKGRRLLDRLQG